MMKRCVLGLLLLSGITTVAWGYRITDVSVTPANPGPSDDVSVTVSGWKPASNYGFDHADVRIVGSFIMLDMYWHSEGFGAQVVTPYAETRCLGKLNPGAYTISVRSWLNGRFGETKSKSFTVSAANTDGEGNHDGDWLHQYWFRPYWPWWCYR
jgi:hypothetical protein